MSVDNPTPDTASGETLSEQEVKALEAANRDEIPDVAAWNSLYQKDLVQVESDDEDENGARTMLTPRGLAALATAQQPAAAGDRPAVISAREFIERNMAREIAEGRAVVTANGYSHEVIGMEFIKPNSAGWDISIRDSKSTYRTFSDVVFKVTWLPASSSPAPVASESAGEGVSDEVALLLAENAHLRSVLMVIRDYPQVETDMELGHQVAGMAMQAEGALENDPQRTGLFNVLIGKLATATERIRVLEASERGSGGLVEALKPFNNLYLDYFDYNVENDEDHQLNIVEYIDRYSDDEAMLNLFQRAREALASLADGKREVMRNFEIGDHVLIPETRDTFQHLATVMAIRPAAKRCIGVRYDDYDSDILWWHEPSGLVHYELDNEASQ